MSCRWRAPWSGTGSRPRDRRFRQSATDTGALGDTTKWNVLSAGSGSVPALHGAADVRLGHGERARRSPTSTRAAPIVAVFVSISWPSTDRTTGTSVAGASPLLVMPAVTATRSCPENAERANVTDGTEMLVVSADATDIVVSVMPSGKRASSELPQPAFWKSLIRTASRRLQRSSGSRMLSASFSAGPKRVPSEPTLAALIAASSRRDRRSRACSPRRSGRTARAWRDRRPLRPATTRCAASRAPSASDRRSPCSRTDRAG